MLALPTGDANLVFLLDSLSGHRFPVDTDLQFSCFLRLQLLSQLWHLLCAFSLLGEHLSLALKLMPLLSILVLDGSPGTSSLLQSWHPSLALSPLPLPRMHSVLTSRLLLGRSGTFSQSIQTSSPPMGFLPPLQIMVSSVTLQLSLDLQYLPRPAAWTQTS